MYKETALSKPDPKYCWDCCHGRKYRGQCRSFVQTYRRGFEFADEVKPARVPQWRNIHRIPDWDRWASTVVARGEWPDGRNGLKRKRDKRRSTINRRADVNFKKQIQNGQLLPC